MNYLAHLLLSGPEARWRLGGLLGDFVKGPLVGERPAAIEAGIKLHRRIDASTDEHTAYRDALASLDPRWRRYAGIALDIWFDHLLAQNWHTWHPQNLEEFCTECWRDFRSDSAYIPPQAKAFMARAEQFKLLQSYREEQVVALTLERVGQRLRRPVALQEMLPELIAGREKLEHNFNKLLTDLNLEASRFRQHYSGSDKS
ncbi:acyl carrier protein phosphodiesterase [Microbulbifer sp. NBRC 101763]|uniref:acyl carrier protein phosphodiesterase n=1 Tax=Microbulbifer TaxID=48073 RepID=UPI000370A423|nr:MULTISPECIES: ACP phosphodiesterase [Microbulbifer]WHI51359.1 ACP phosphodiesterase [Microbulbifer sp. MLAF003]